MFSLALGILLWSAVHLMGRLAPALRQKLGGRVGMIALAIAAVALMIFGYRIAGGAFYWGRTPMLTGINNLLMLIAVYIFACAGMKTWLGRRIPQPMMWGVLVWAAAHLLVNGDTPSFLLFGGMAVCALVQMAVVLRAEGWTPPPAKPVKFELFALLGTLMVYGGIALVHTALGYPVFG